VHVRPRARLSFVPCICFLFTPYLPKGFQEPAYVWLTPYGNQTKDHFMTLGYVLEGNFHCFDNFLPDRRSFVGTFTL
jgi:hypothetical protein